MKHILYPHAFFFFQSVMYCFLITLSVALEIIRYHVLFTLSAFIISINCQKGKYTN